MVWNNTLSNRYTPTLFAVRAYDANNNLDPSVPATTFSYGDAMHLTAADNGYQGLVEFVYDRWRTDHGPAYTISDCNHNEWQARANTDMNCPTGANQWLAFRGNGIPAGTVASRANSLAM